MGEKMKFMLHVGSRSGKVSLPVGGRFNVMNALAASAAAWVLGVSFEDIVQGLESFQPMQMRMELRMHPTGALLINDAYNANPVSVIHSVRSMVETYHDKKRILVLGTMLELGEQSEAMHFNTGSELGRFGLHQVYLIGPDTGKVKEGALAVGAPDDKFIQVRDKLELLNRLSSILDGNTVVLFKGSRGIHLEETVHELLKEMTVIGGH
jgi:UDP-N-acetylmuramyl pentapeptide synthase